MNEKIPVGMSAGGDNAYYHNCNHVQHSKAYAACLHINARYKDGSLDKELYNDCATAIRREGCPAVRMRKEEIEKGEALYYKPRKDAKIPIVKIDKSSLSYAKGWNQVGGKSDNLPANKPPTNQIVKPKAEKKEGLQARNVDYSEVINKTIKEQKSPEEEKSSKQTKPLTLAEIAAQMRGDK